MSHGGLAGDDVHRQLDRASAQRLLLDAYTSHRGRVAAFLDKRSCGRVSPGRSSRRRIIDDPYCLSLLDARIRGHDSDYWQIARETKDSSLHSW